MWTKTRQGPSENAWGPDSTVLREILETIRDLTHQAGGTAVVEQCPLPVKRGIDVWDGSAYGDREVETNEGNQREIRPNGHTQPRPFPGRDLMDSAGLDAIGLAAIGICGSRRAGGG